MKKNELIQKWLDHNLNEEELVAFKQLDAYSSLQYIDTAAQAYKAPAYDSALAYQKLQQKLKNTNKKRFLPYAVGVAATVLIAICVYFTMFQPDMVVHSSLATIDEPIILPDDTEVLLLPNSSITYDDDTYAKQRSILLEGAAYFDVEKGTTFTVQTEQGLVTVLGTQFSVKDWGSFYEVVCYEGSVKVEGRDKVVVLTPNMSFKIIAEDVVVADTSEEILNWSSKFTTFNRVPLSVVLDFIERNYGVTIQKENDIDGLFTGKISHEDLNEALSMVTIPFQLTFEIRNSTVILKSE